MTIKMAKSESGAELSECRRSGTLASAFKVSGGVSVAAGGVKKVKSQPFRSGEALGSWLPVQEWKSSSSKSSTADGSGAGMSGLRGPWATWESSEEVILAMVEGLPCGEYVGVRTQVQEVESHLGEKL